MRVFHIGTDQFVELEGLGKIVIGARVEPGDLVRPAVACGEHEHRRDAAFLAPAIEHGQPVNLGKPEIEHDRVIIFGRAHEMPVLAIGREIDGIADALKRGLELFAERGLVFYDQNAQYLSPVLSGLSRLPAR